MSSKTITTRAGSALALLACALFAGTVTATAQAAEAPSVDAYAGQALVLGKPHRKTLSSSETADGTGASGERQAEVESKGNSSSPTGAATSTSGTGSAAGSATNSTGSESRPSARSTEQRRTHQSTSDSRRSAGVAATAPPLKPQLSSDALPLSGGDLALLAFVVLLLAGMAFTLRRTRPNA